MLIEAVARALAFLLFSYFAPVYSSPIPCPAVSKDCGPQFHQPLSYSAYESLSCALLDFGTGYWGSALHVGCPIDHIRIYLP